MNFSKILRSVYFFAAMFCFLEARASTSIERFLLVAGANDGGKERVTLRYASRDAQTVSQVFQEMGGVAKSHVVRLENPNRKEFQASLVTLAQQLQQATGDTRKEVILYYSGHADEQGLLLGEDKFSWQELRHAVDALPAQVKITLLDACGSGAITRLKGGARQPAFLVDLSSDMKGYAFLTSSSENEVAQESDRIGGSFFTQSLVTGMRGAADLNGDLKVTLSEAYQYAFNETMHRTQQTAGGTQHPSRDMKLSGTGDVVMTDLRDVSAGLVFANDVEGRLYIRDQKNNLIAELQKTAGRSLELGMAPGRYNILLDKGTQYSADGVELADGARQTLSPKAFHVVASERTTSRGSIKNSVMDSLRSAYMQEGTHWDLGFLVATQSKPWNGHQAALLATVSTQNILGNQISIVANFSKRQQEGWQVSNAFNIADSLQGIQFSAGFNIANNIQGFQFSSGGNIANQVVGIQIGPFNIAKNIDGHQFAAWNMAGSVSGYQVSAWNIAGSVGKSQVSAWNIAGSTGGAQVGAWNIAGTCGGAQVGAWNIAGKSHGPTFGIFNIVGKTDKPVFGLLNIVGNGYYNVSLSTSELGWGISTLQLGTSTMHTNFHVASTTDRKVRAQGYGFGTQFGMDSTKYWFGLNADWFHIVGKDQNPWLDENSWGRNWQGNYLAQARLEYGYRFAKFFALYGGISGNYLFSSGWDNVLVTPQGDYQAAVYRDSYYAWPGAFAGVRFGRL